MAYEVNPEIYNYGNPIGNFFQGYQAAFIPQQMKAQQEENALKRQQMQQEMQYNPEIYKQKLLQMQLQNQNLTSQGDLEKLKYQQMMQQYQREKDFLSLLSGGRPTSSPQTQQSPMQPEQMPIPSQVPISNQPAMLSPMSTQQPPMSTASMNGQPQQPSQDYMSYLDNLYVNDPSFRVANADLLNKYTNAKTNTFYDSNSGQVITSETLPSGRIINKVTQAGLDPYNKEFGKQKADIDIEQYKNALASVDLVNDAQSSIDYIDTLLDNPEMKNVIGHFGKSKMAEWFGNAGQKALYGNIKGSAGKLSLSVLNSMKGSSSDADRSYAISMNPSTEDSFDEFIGKYNALKSMSNVIRDRSQYIAQQIDSGVSPADAKRDALDKFKIDAIMTDGTNVYSVPVDQIEERRKQGLKEYYGRY